MKRKITALLLAASAIVPAAAQELRTSYFMQTSDYRHEMNPALLDHGYVSMPFVLGNLNVGTTGNIGISNFVYKMEPGWQGYGVDGRTYTTFLHPNVDANKFLGDLKENNRLGVNFKYTLLSVGFRGMGGVNVIDLSLRSNTNVNLPKSLFAFAKEQQGNTEYNISNLGARTENMAELALGHSHKIGDKWRVGGKAKILFGLAYAGFKGDDISITMQDDLWRLKGDVSMTAALMGTKFKTSEVTDPDNPDRAELDFDDIDFTPGLGGVGLAFDLGATYKVMDNLTVSAAVTDLGFVSWKNAQMASSRSEWSFSGFKNDILVGDEDDNNGNAVSIEDQFDDLGDDFEDMLKVYDDGQKTATRALAATVNVGVEYALPMYDKFRFGFLYTSRIAGRYSWHQGMLSANVRPAKWFEASLSGAVSSTGATAGLVLDFHAKHFNFFIGADRFMSKLTKDFIPVSSTNSNISLGFSFPMK